VDKNSSTHLVWEENSVSITISIIIKTTPIKKNQLLNNSLTHIKKYIKSKLMNDIETNPGPGEKLRVVTINCRGLGEINKFQLLLNKAYNMMQKGNLIMMIQETMVTI
jgi:hypothetical protein